MVLLAVATSLPEIRKGDHRIFGTNAFLVALLFLADLFYPGGSVLEAVDRASLFTAAMGIATTSVYLVGLIERRNRIVLGMGIDSLVVLVTYAATLAVLFRLR